MSLHDLIVVGGGPAGLAAALNAWRNGLRKILIIERDKELGGILNQCIHTGFGLNYFREELTGPEYAGRFIQMLQSTQIETALDTMALKITPAAPCRGECPNQTGSRGRFHTRSHEVHAVSKDRGYAVLSAKCIVLAMGCRERARGAVGIAGTRPAGIFTAGTAQRYVNMEGLMPGKRIVILGSGDVGLIMARRMTLEGATVLACVEIQPKPGGLTRNVVQCLHDYGIPLYLSHTITEIRGHKRVEQVAVAQVDEGGHVIPGTAFALACDTVLLSVGLIPENELANAAGLRIDGENITTSAPGIFACGNTLHVHDLVDNVTAESERAGAAAAAYVLSGETP